MGAAPENLPERLSYESLMGPAANQGDTFECVAYTIAGLKRFHEYKQSGVWLDFDPHTLYARCKEVDGAPGANGTYPRVAMDLLRQEGMLSSDGQRYTVSAAARLRSLYDIRHALATQGPVLLGIRIDVGAFASMGVGAFASLPSAGHLSGHCMLAVGYDDRNEALRIRNSWGVAWGDSGHLWLPYAYLETVDNRFDAWSSVDA